MQHRRTKWVWIHGFSSGVWKWECFRTVECQQVESSRWMEQQQKKRDGPVRCVREERRASERLPVSVRSVTWWFRINRILRIMPTQSTQSLFANNYSVNEAEGTVHLLIQCSRKYLQRNKSTQHKSAKLQVRGYSTIKPAWWATYVIQ